jgi:transaldolase
MGRGSAVLDRDTTRLEQEAHNLALEGFRPRYGELADAFPSEPVWAALRALGTRLWLDTGDLEEARGLWRREFSNLTTNNTLANREVQKGLFDDVIRRAGERLRQAQPSISPEELVREVGFVVNARLSLRLVEAFDATVSVELHPALAADVTASVRYGRRYFALCPERFLIKVPLTPAGLIATRRLSDAGIPVNFTLGFSARQNILAAHVARSRYVNVFMGRLNAFVADSGLGDGQGIGEKATLATQRALRATNLPEGRPLLIGASMRSAQQAADLAGLDVFTMPTSVAREFVETVRDPATIRDRTGDTVTVALAPGRDPSAIGLTALWEIPGALPQVAAELGAAASAESFTPDALVDRLDAAGMSLFRRWTREERQAIEKEGKIPSWRRWGDDLATGRAQLDDLMTTAALHSFAADQRALDDRIRNVLGLTG